MSSPECELEEISVDTVHEPITYLVARQDPVVKTLLWTTNVIQFNCPYIHSISITEDGTTRTPSVTDLAVVSFNEVTSLLQIDTNDFTYDGRTLNILFLR